MRQNVHTAQISPTHALGCECWQQSQGALSCGQPTERDLSRAQNLPDGEGALLLDFTIAAGSPFDGKRVREIGLPPGAIIVMLRHQLREDVPTADSQLIAGDQISVLIAPEANTALPLLRKGAGMERDSIETN